MLKMMEKFIKKSVYTQNLKQSYSPPYAINS